MEFRAATTDDKKLGMYATLMQQCFPGANICNSKYLSWLYRGNPDGEVVGYDAFDGEQIVAHHAFIPSTIQLYGKKVKGLLGVNVATHPAYQGKGLYAKLGEMALQSGAEKGFACAYCVANANSTPGVVRKLKFQLVQPLDAKIGFGSLNIQTSPDVTQFTREWTQDSLNWRCSNPNNPVFWEKSSRVCRLYAKSVNQLIPVYTELHPDVLPSVISKGNPLRLSPIRLFIGLVPGEPVHFKKYFPIPGRLKPSPLNFVFRSLNQESMKLDKGAVCFSFLDFDAY